MAQKATRQARTSTPKTKTKLKSKQETVLRLLRRKRGATVDDIVGATGWQAHTVRGFLSRTVKGKLGLLLTSERTKSGRFCYQVRSVS